LIALGLSCGLFGAGCVFRTPDPRDFEVRNLPPIPADARSSDVVQTSGAPKPEPQKPAEVKPKPQQRPLNIPSDLPGADAPPIGALPKIGAGGFPVLPPLQDEPKPAPSATGKPLTLAELEQIALQNNPTIRQAAADVDIQRGQAVQAGLLPNPVVGYQHDQLGTGFGDQRRGQPGIFFEWVWKTAGKLSLARLVQLMDYLSAQVSLRRAQIDLVNQVRTQYFALLVAREAVAVNRALSRFSEDLYRAQQALVKGAEQAPYEPLQSYVLALQARGALVQSRNRYSSAWRQLAATLGRPTMPLTEVVGRADAPTPNFNFEHLQQLVLANHTDVQIAQNRILQARYGLRLAEVIPIPDLSAHIYLERDWTTPPNREQVGIQVGGPIPIFDRNQGGRLAAKATLARAIQEVPRVQNDLSGRLAAAFESYSNNRVLVRFYRYQAIPRQVQVYRAIHQRYMLAPQQVSYTEIVNAQQTLATLLNSYLTSLGALWTSVVDLAALAQTDELYLPEVPADAVSVEQMLNLEASPVAPPQPNTPQTPAPEPRVAPRKE
jgi:cobalt-zinc-cadmium efflux system outer membrane protein